MNITRQGVRYLPVAGRWCVHAYYTLCPYAPDGSGRLLIAGADRVNQFAEVIILSADGEVVDRFGHAPITGSFWHTGLWQSWSGDAKYVYYQCGTMAEPRIARRELASGKEVIVAGDMEGAPPSGEPGVSCAHGMLYAAGYGDGRYKPEQSPVPFAARDQHGIWQVTFDPPGERLMLSTAEILDRHPHRDRLLEADRETGQRLGAGQGLTLMTYCVRWNPRGDRFLFYFGNHCVARERGEPRVAYVFTSDRAIRDIHLTVDLSFDRRGVHWGWHSDGEHLIGYGSSPDDISQQCLTQVRYDGTGYRRISKHRSGGHPNISAVNYNLLVTDTSSIPGQVEFIDLRSDSPIHTYHLPRVNGTIEPPGRNAFRVCHHPVFNPDCTKVLVNTLCGDNAVLCEVDVPRCD